MQTTAPESPPDVVGDPRGVRARLEFFDFGRTDLNGESLREFRARVGHRTKKPIVYSYLGCGEVSGAPDAPLPHSDH